MADLLQVALADNPLVLYDFRSTVGLSTDYSVNSQNLTLDGVTAGTSSTFPGSAQSAKFTKASANYGYVDPNTTIDNLFPDTTAVATMECIFRLDDLSGSKAFATKGNSYSSNPFWGFTLNNYTGTSFLPQTTIHRTSGYETNRLGGLSGTYFQDDGTWYYVQTVMFADGSANRWWLDGTSYVNSAQTNGAGNFPDDSAYKLNIGAMQTGVSKAYNADRYMSGDIAYLAIYDYDIGDTALQAHYDVAVNGAEEPYGVGIYIPVARRRRRNWV